MMNACKVELFMIAIGTCVCYQMQIPAQGASDMVGNYQQCILPPRWLDVGGMWLDFVFQMIIKLFNT